MPGGLWNDEDVWISWMIFGFREVDTVDIFVFWPNTLSSCEMGDLLFASLWLYRTSLIFVNSASLIGLTPTRSRSECPFPMVHFVLLVSSMQLCMKIRIGKLERFSVRLVANSPVFHRKKNPINFATFSG